MIKEKTGKVIYLANFGYPVHICFCPSEAAFHVEMKRLKITGIAYPLHDAAEGVVSIFDRSDGKGCIIMVCLRKFKDRREAMSVIIHESVHVWQFICEHIGEVSAGVEIEAYGIQNICGELVAAYEKHHHGGKKWL